MANPSITLRTVPNHVERSNFGQPYFAFGLTLTSLTLTLTLTLNPNPNPPLRGDGLFWPRFTLGTVSIVDAGPTTSTLECCKPERSSSDPCAISTNSAYPSEPHRTLGAAESLPTPKHAWWHCRSDRGTLMDRGQTDAVRTQPGGLVLDEPPLDAGQATEVFGRHSNSRCDLPILSPV